MLDIRQALETRYPTLFQHHRRVATIAFNVDREFGNCVDGFVLVDLQQMKPRKRKRYLECGYDGGNSCRAAG